MFLSLVLASALGQFSASPVWCEPQIVIQQPVVIRERRPTAEPGPAPAAKRYRLKDLSGTVWADDDLYWLQGWVDLVNGHLRRTGRYLPAGMRRDADGTLNSGILLEGRKGEEWVTSDPNFLPTIGSKHKDHDPAAPCPGPGPCPYPNKPKPKPIPDPLVPPISFEFDRLAGPALLFGLAVLIVVVGLIVRRRRTTSR